MRNIKLVIEYDGSRYDGWQKQPKNPKSITIQEKMEAVLSKMADEEIELIGAIRTEAGVHAYGQVANFKTDCKLKLYEIKHYLNRYLPRDIAVLEVMEVPERFHASFNAKGFKFQYKLTTGEVPSVFERKYNYYCFQKPDVIAMRNAAKLFIGKHDFKGFSDNRRMKKSTEREIKSIDIYEDINAIEVTIEADDFWPNMARIIVGTLLEVGLGNCGKKVISEVLTTGNRDLAGPTMEAKGLFLFDVDYN